MSEFFTSIFGPIIQVLRPIIYVPLLNVLVFIYYYIPDIGVAIIIITIIIRLLLFRSFHKTLKQQKIMQSLQPKIEEIRKRFKDDKQKEMEALMGLYRENEVSPFSSCSTLLIQLPILAALSTLFARIGSDSILNDLYSFVPHVTHINTMFLGFVDLAAKNNYILVGLAAILQYIQTKLTLPTHEVSDPTQRTMQNSMLYFFPVILFVSILQFPAGLALYILASTLFSIGQQYYMTWKDAKESL